MHIKLFLIEPYGREPLYIAARDSDHAGELFVGFEAAAGRYEYDFSILRVDNRLSPEKRVGLREMLRHGLAGFATFDALGWSVTPPA